MKKLRVLFILVIALVLAFSITACAQETTPTSDTDTSTADAITPAVTVDITHDRSGLPITLPEEINTIISMGPGITEIIAALGFADKIIAIDAFSYDVPGLSTGLPQFDMMAPDGERLLALMPDAIFITGWDQGVGATDPYRLLSDAGVTVIFIPTSDSIAGIQEDIIFVGAVLGAEDRAKEIVAAMQAEIDEFRAIGETITQRRTVYFELSPAPWMISFGEGTFLHEMLVIIGAENAFADLENWTTLSDEIILAADPDVILTSVNFIDNPIEEIKSRPGWSVLYAVENDRIFEIDTNASNRPSHNIVIAMREMAVAIYPEYFGN